MSALRRRGACPSLSAPMSTGDGLLARLSPRHGTLSPGQLAGVAEAAEQHGNGLLEITARGSLQIRGLTEASAKPFAEAIEMLGIAADAGVEVRVGPLAGDDSGEWMDPRPIADLLREEISRRGLAERLAPKVSIIVDGGGALGLSGIAADVRLEAVDADSWRVSIGRAAAATRVLGCGDADSATRVALDVLTALVEAGPTARGRDLGADILAGLRDRLRSTQVSRMTNGSVPVGRFCLRGDLFAVGFALPFGQITADDLAYFGRAIAPGYELRLAPGRGILVLGLEAGAMEHLTLAAETGGLVTHPDDPRLRIATCAGAPACGSAYLPTKQIAGAVVAEHPALLEASAILHVSGCAKQCAKPSGPSVSLVGSAHGCDVVGDRARPDAEIRRILLRLGAAYGQKRRRSA